MARSDLLVSLVRTAVSHDKAGVRSTVGAIAAEARAAGHRLLAARLEEALEAPLLARPSAPGSTGELEPETLMEVFPKLDLSDLVLATNVHARLAALVDEQRRSAILRTHGLEPRNRILVSGPPGNGKTSVAEGLAKALGYPLLVVNYPALVGSHLGETNRRLESLFRYVSMRPAVVFFDEFDAIGKERADRQETGEMKRVVASLLMNVDALPSHVVVVAATNHPEMLDRAVWRRFQLKMELAAPEERMLAAFLARRLKLPEGSPLVTRATGLLGSVSFAEAEDFAFDVRRRAALAKGHAPTLAQSLELELADRFPSTVNWTNHGVRPDEAASPPKPAKRRRTTGRKTQGDSRTEEVREISSDQEARPDLSEAEAASR